MYFTKTNHLHDLEDLMRGVPNFRKGQNGSIVPRNEMERCMEEQPPPACYEELMTTTMSVIRCKPFLERLKRYIKESEGKPMIYRNDKHKAVYEEIIEKKDKKNYALLSALYLLTADFKLWQVMKHRTKQNKINFHDTKFKGIHENGYTLYCVAKDLYLGTKHLSISDLADTGLISPGLFALICNAMAIRRFGIKAIRLAERSEGK